MRSRFFWIFALVALSTTSFAVALIPEECTLWSESAQIQAPVTDCIVFGTLDVLPPVNHNVAIIDDNNPTINQVMLYLKVLL